MTLYFSKIKKIGNDIVLQLLELEVLIFMQPSSSISAITRDSNVLLIMLVDISILNPKIVGRTVKMFGLGGLFIK